MRSMTGFGRCIMENELFTQQWEIRSVNGKRLDIKWTLPPSVANLENRFDKMVRKYAARGRVNIDLNLQFLAADPDLHFDKARARGMLASVVALATERGDSFQPEEQVDTISTRFDPRPCMEFSKAWRMAFFALRMAATLWTLCRVT